MFTSSCWLSHRIFNVWMVGTLCLCSWNSASIAWNCETTQTYYNVIARINSKWLLVPHFLSVSWWKYLQHNGSPEQHPYLDVLGKVQLGLLLGWFSDWNKHNKHNQHYNSAHNTLLYYNRTHNKHYNNKHKGRGVTMIEHPSPYATYAARRKRRPKGAPWGSHRVR